MPVVGQITEMLSSPKIVEWTIDNFFALPKDICYTIGSRTFFFDEMSWRLVAFPNGTQDLPGCMQVLATTASLHKRTLHWELAINRPDGTTLKKSSGVRGVEEVRCDPGKSLKIMYDVVKKACLTSSRSLTIVCKLYCDEGKAEMEASSQTETSSRIDKLLLDLNGLLHSGENSDVTVRVKGVDFRLHRTILGARTPFFSAMFKHEMAEKATGFVEIDDCEADIFRTFLVYVYTGTVENISPENMFGLYEVADKYQVDELKADCLECIKNTISIDSFCDVIAVAMRYGEQGLAQVATNFLSENIKDVMATEKWKSFLSDNPVESNELLLEALRRQK